MSAKKQPKPSNIKEYKLGILKGLTFRQRRFAEYYVICGNKGEAAIKAGYSVKTASLQGRALYRNETVQAYIRFLIQGQDEEILASVDESRRRLSSALRGDALEDIVVMIRKRKSYYDKKGKKVIEEVSEPVIIKKHISMRDQIEASKHYFDIMKIETPQLGLEESQDDKLIKALNDRASNAGSSTTKPAAEIIFETSSKPKEDNDDEQ